MKQGDTTVVQIQGIEVGQAVVERVEGNQVTLIIPAQRVVMGLRTELTPGDNAPKDTSGTERIIEGAERSAAAGGEIVDLAPVQPVEPAVQPAQPTVLPELEPNDPAAVESDSAAGKTVADAAARADVVEPEKKVESPVTITSADGRSYTLPPGTTWEDLNEPAANE